MKNKKGIRTNFAFRFSSRIFVATIFDFEFVFLIFRFRQLAVRVLCAIAKFHRSNLKPLHLFRFAIFYILFVPRKEKPFPQNEKKIRFRGFSYDLEILFEPSDVVSMTQFFHGSVLYNFPVHHWRFERRRHYFSDFVDQLTEEYFLFDKFNEKNNYRSFIRAFHLDFFPQTSHFFFVLRIFLKKRKFSKKSQKKISSSLFSKFSTSEDKRATSCFAFS